MAKQLLEAKAQIAEMEEELKQANELLAKQAEKSQGWKQHWN